MVDEIKNVLEENYTAEIEVIIQELEETRLNHELVDLAIQIRRDIDHFWQKADDFMNSIEDNEEEEYV